jgi:putative radical SAM enzyme (TIGR03279 family)
MQRIIEQRLSPQYVSVHATDLDVRAYLLGIEKERADISDKIARMLNAGIEIHAQVVLCPKINDGEILKKTIFDLAAYYPRVSSVAVVPLGLTRYNTDQRLTAVTPDFCRQTITEITKIQSQLREQLGTTFAFLGDEIYLKAGRKVPGRKHYGDYPQIEDGIGMVRSFNNQFSSLVKKLEQQPSHSPSEFNGTIMTGTLFAPVLREKIDELNNRCGTKLRVVGVENDYFGGDVSVAGLLTGSDLVKAQKEIQGDFVIIPRTTLKSDEEILLDGMTLTELKEHLGLPVLPFDLRSFSNWLSSSIPIHMSSELVAQSCALKA